MNNLLLIKGEFEQAPNLSRSKGCNIPTHASVSSDKVKNLVNDLIEIKKYWATKTLISGVLVCVCYSKVIAKSNRIKKLLGTKSNQSIVGAKFNQDPNIKHLITHYISRSVFSSAIEQLKKCSLILESEFGGSISHETIANLNEKKLNYSSELLKKSAFIQLIVDTFYVEKLEVPTDSMSVEESTIVTLYKTEVQTHELLSRLGIKLSKDRILLETTVLLMPKELVLLKSNAPYLIAMGVTDLSEITKDNFECSDRKIMSIPEPKNEPTIGVIDMQFDTSVYFSQWVDYRNMLSPEINVNAKDKEHGTAVTSLIVDGPSINPSLDDGCGRFKVRHFGVATGQAFNSFTVLKLIEEIISSNLDIKVWNLSLGSQKNIPPNFISPEAAILDKLQFENDVIFVISGTNLNKGETKTRPIGSPADSINALVVNAVDAQKRPASYSRCGPVLSFFVKPDVSYYGGDGKDKLRVCLPTGEAWVSGTSFAAPWISRKLAYLIHVQGLSREIAKALLVHSSTGWQKTQYASTLIGYGVVPVRIEDVINSKDDELQFVIQGVSEKYTTYDYNLPIPKDGNEFPFVAKATLCYFPACERTQGVDYTNTEIDFTFGRINNKKPFIKPINNDYQDDDEVAHHLFEKDAREIFRKWDNIKHIRECFTKRKKNKKAYVLDLWGMRLTTKERLDEKFGANLKFGIVVTLKEIHQKNRLDEFIQRLKLRGWIVQRINIQTKIDIYEQAEEMVQWDS